MQHFQDKLCNVLTFAGLVGVIVWGTVSLWPEAEATPLLQPEAEELSADTLPADTLPELPAVPEEPLPANAEPDSIGTDSLSNLMEMADTAAAPQPQHPQHTDSTHHHEPRATHQSPTTDHSAPAKEAAAPAQ